MSQLNLRLNSKDRDLLNVLDRMPNQLPLTAKAAFHRLNGARPTEAEAIQTGQLLDQLAIHGLVTRRGGYMGNGGKFYAITADGHDALRA